MNDNIELQARVNARKKELKRLANRYKELNQFVMARGGVEKARARRPSFPSFQNEH